MTSFDERILRAAPFYQHYWDHVVTESVGDRAVATRNVVVEAIVDLLCFAQRNHADTDVIWETARQMFIQLKMDATFDGGTQPGG